MTREAEVTRGDAVPVAMMRHAAARRVQERFPHVSAWYGEATGSYWAFVPFGEQGRLAEESTPQALEETLVGPCGRAGA